MFQRFSVLSWTYFFIALNGAIAFGQPRGGDAGKGGDASVTIINRGTIIISPQGGAGGNGGSANSRPESSSATIGHYSIKDNRDIDGHDIILTDGQFFLTVADINACAAACDGMKPCLAFSIDRWNNRCFLKNGFKTSVLDPRSSIGVKKPKELPSVSINEAQLSSLVRKRLYGAVQSHTRVADVGSCRATCNADLHCVGFNFIHDSGNSGINCETFKVLEGYEADNRIESGYKYQSRK